MTLTHEKVRAILARLERDGQPDECDHDCDERCDECSPLHDTQTLCEEWLAARTVRWSHNALKLDERIFGYAQPYLWNDSEWTAHAGDEAARRSTLSEARAWLEAKAREAGYEVEGGA